LTGMALAQLSISGCGALRFRFRHCPGRWTGITIAHLTDIHVGRLTCGRVLRDMVNTTNALRADLVLLTGDLIDYELSDLSEGIALVKAMEGRSGLWMIEGNHDLADNGGEFERARQGVGRAFSMNESAVAMFVVIRFNSSAWAGWPAMHGNATGRMFF